MPRINLLPWREVQRRERKLHFMIALGGATLAAMAFAFIAYLMFDSMIDAQQHRNNVLRNQIKILDRQIEEINSLESEKQRFIARMEIIEKLQRSRPEIVHLFDEIVRTLPDGVYLTSVKQTDTRLRFEGVAQSSTRVSSFMRNIDSSEWLKNPELEVVQANKGEAFGSTFVLDAEQVSHAGADDDTPGAKGPAMRRVARRGPTP
ncbi:MAG TPA: PilN domain-containing protein [Steroidobacteraceae bacterium]|nr:PilN domain-containing protein [Steroidobacteraceae bacterium]